MMTTETHFYLMTKYGCVWEVVPMLVNSAAMVLYIGYGEGVLDVIIQTLVHGVERQ